MKIDGTENQKLCYDEFENINIVGNYIYYNIKDEPELYRMGIDGTGSTKVIS